MMQDTSGTSWFVPVEADAQRNRTSWLAMAVGLVGAAVFLSAIVALLARVAGVNWLDGLDSFAGVALAIVATTLVVSVLAALLGASWLIGARPRIRNQIDACVIVVTIAGLTGWAAFFVDMVVLFPLELAMDQMGLGTAWRAASMAGVGAAAVAGAVTSMPASRSPRLFMIVVGTYCMAISGYAILAGAEGPRNGLATAGFVAWPVALSVFAHGLSTRRPHVGKGSSRLKGVLLLAVAAAFLGIGLSALDVATRTLVSVVLA